MSAITMGTAINKPAAPAAEVRYWGLLAAFAALVIVCLLPTPQGLPVAGQIMLGMLLFSVILWMT
jgi:sodium-dependent dicarboxylate transporter 2/3/5